MKFLLKKCPRCGRYTLREACPVCKINTKVAHPPRFSPQDKYVKYRIILRELSTNIKDID